MSLDQEMTEDERLAASLRSERDYEDRIYRSRAYLGTSAALSQGLFNYLAASPLDTSNPARDAYYESLSKPDRAAEAERALAVESAKQQATQRARGVGRQIAGRLAADPTKAAGVLEEATKYEERVSKQAGLSAQTQADKAAAAEAVQRASEKKRIEDEVQAEKEVEAEQKRQRNVQAASQGLQAVATGIAASRPGTYEKRLEDKAIRTGERAGRLETRLAKQTMGATDQSIDPLKAPMDPSALTGVEGKTGRLATKLTTAQEKSGAAATDLATYQAAQLAKEQERLKALRSSNAQLAALLSPTTVR